METTHLQWQLQCISLHLRRSTFENNISNYNTRNESESQILLQLTSFGKRITRKKNVLCLLDMLKSAPICFVVNFDFNGFKTNTQSNFTILPIKVKRSFQNFNSDT